MNEGAGYERMVGLGLLGVVACLAWPVWGVIIAAHREFTWSVAATALIPLTINVLWLALCLRVPAHIASTWHRTTHGMADRLHGGTHRHA
jgi:hypothetical protein